MILDIKCPRFYVPLLGNLWRYGLISGGRASGKSYSGVDLFLIANALAEPYERFLIAREHGSSLKDSTKNLIEQRISDFNLERHFEVMDKEIRIKGGGLMTFKGLKPHNVATIKSYNNYKYFLFEEAEKVTETMIHTITPTIRRDDAKMLFIMNPPEDKNALQIMFEENKGNQKYVHVHANYFDNPFITKDILAEIEHIRATKPDVYHHIWLGNNLERSKAAVFTNYKIESFETPSDAEFIMGADWGFSNDPTVLIRAFIKGKNLFIDYEASAVGCPIQETPNLFAKVPLSNTMRIVADNARPEMIDYMRKNGYSKIIPSKKGAGSIKEGVNYLQSFDTIFIHQRCRRTQDNFKFYSYKVNQSTEQVLGELKDDDNDCIDALRYATELIRSPRIVTVSSLY